MAADSNNKLKAVIIDDEWLIRSELRTLLNTYPDVEVVGEAENVPQAALIIQNTKPDVIFLDIQMPGETGFDLLNNVKFNCNIVFVTAYNEYAIKAFEVNAIDYLLKPITKARLDTTIQRLLTRDGGLYVHPMQQMNLDDVLYLMVDDSFKFIKINTIKCILAEGNYSFIIIHNDKKELVTKTLKEWEVILPKKYFVRIHRSTIVDFEYVVNVKKLKNQTYEVYIDEIEKPFMMSRRYAVKLKDVLCW